MDNGGGFRMPTKEVTIGDKSGAAAVLAEEGDVARAVTVVAVEEAVVGSSSCAESGSKARRNS